MIPEGGDKTDEPIRTRGWTHWHHLFTPRQLLTHGLLAEMCENLAESNEALIGCLLGLGRIANWDSRLTGWSSAKGDEKGNQVFNNQALNTLSNYSNRPLSKFNTCWFLFDRGFVDTCFQSRSVLPCDARDLRESCDLWITDPPYADAINYHELGDFFLAWYDKQLAKTFPDWSPTPAPNSPCEATARISAAQWWTIYRNLTAAHAGQRHAIGDVHPPRPGSLGRLGMILWAAGLKATAAWTISTETEAAGIKKGNYVQGTVCLVLRKRLGSEPGFLDEVYPLVEDEVRRQIDSMQALDEGGEPNFNDADYQLAAYAAALKVLTQYGNLDGRDVEHEVFAVRDR